MCVMFLFQEGLTLAVETRTTVAPDGPTQGNAETTRATCPRNARSRAKFVEHLTQ